jgi:hypothetical protein
METKLAFKRRSKANEKVLYTDYWIVWAESFDISSRHRLSGWPLPGAAGGDG